MGGCHRGSLSEDDEDYYQRKFAERQEKCRFRVRVFAVLDLVLCGVSLVFCLTAIGFHLRNHQKRSARLQNGASGPPVVRVTTTEPSSVTSQEPNSVVVAVAPLSPTQDWLIAWADTLSMINCCILIAQFIAAILLFVAGAKNYRRSSICLLTTWLLLSIFTLPFQTLIIARYLLLCSPAGFILATLEFLFRLVGIILVLDYKKFLQTKINSSRFYAVQKEEVDVRDVPGSVASCLFCKSCCLLIDECC